MIFKKSILDLEIIYAKQTFTFLPNLVWIKKLFFGVNNTTLPLQ